MHLPFLRSTAALLIAWAMGSSVFATDPDTFSKVVSFQFESSLDEAGTTIQSKVVSFQYFDKLDDADLTFTTSAAVSFYFDGTPIIVNQPNDQIARSGTNVVLSVEADINPPFTYQWRKDEVNITGKIAPTLTITNAQSANSGVYSVSVTNSFSQTTSRSVDITVISGATIPKPANLPLNHVTLPLASNLSTRPNRAVSAQLRWFNPSTQQFEAVPINISTTKLSVVITHGWRDGVQIEQDDEANGKGVGWIKRMATALINNPYSSNINVFAWDWGPFANISMNPAFVAVGIPDQGAALGGALMDALGTGYSEPIHFIGHSFGCGVNCLAADYVHGDSRPTGDARLGYASSRTHMTLLDEAEIAASAKLAQAGLDTIAVGMARDIALDDYTAQTKNLVIQVVPKRSRWIDNYISEVGYLQSEAANILLLKTNLVLNPVIGHGYAYEWYIKTIQSPSSSMMGHRNSFESNWDSTGQPPPAPSYYRQNILGQNELELSPISSSVIASLVSMGRVAVYPAALASQTMVAIGNATIAVTDATYRRLTATGNAIHKAEISAINYSANVIVDQVEAFSKPNGTPVFLSSPDSTTPAYFQPIQVNAAPANNNYAWWDATYTFSGNQSFLPQPNSLRQAVSANKDASQHLASPESISGDAASAAYISLSTHVPLEAIGMTFEYKMMSAGVDDFMSVGLEGDSLCVLDARYVADGVWQSSPVFQVSDYRAQDVSLVIAFIAPSGPPSGSLSIRNIQFYIPPRPVLTLGQNGQQMNLSWPMNGIDWTLETTADLTQPNSWQPVLNPEIIQDYQRRVNLTPTAPRQFFRLRK